MASDSGEGALKQDGHVRWENDILDVLMFRHNSPDRPSSADMTRYTSAGAAESSFSVYVPQARFDGYMMHDRQDVFQILLSADNLSVKRDSEMIDGHACFVVSGDSPHGKYTVWLDPESGYLPRKIQGIKAASNTYNRTSQVSDIGYNVAATDRKEFVMRNALGADWKELTTVEVGLDTVGIEQIEGYWVITSGRAYARREFADGLSSESVADIFIEDIEFYSSGEASDTLDFDGLIPEGTVIRWFEGDLLRRLVWKDGRIQVPIPKAEIRAVHAAIEEELDFRNGEDTSAGYPPGDKNLNQVPTSSDARPSPLVIGLVVSGLVLISAAIALFFRRERVRFR